MEVIWRIVQELVWYEKSSMGGEDTIKHILALVCGPLTLLSLKLILVA